MDFSLKMNGNSSNITFTNRNGKTISIIRNGYDLPVVGLEDGEFLSIHVPAICCIFVSLICAIVVITTSFTNKKQKAKSFFQWTKCERLAVYMALCDGLFNVCHSMDHLHMVISSSHIFPRELCTFYAFMIVEFVTAQYLMVNIVSINTFVMIFFHKDIRFGKYDWRLLLWIFGFPFVVGVAGIGLKVLGTNGVYCHIDGASSYLYVMLFFTIPVAAIMLINSTLYWLTWFRIRKEEKRFEAGPGRKTTRAGSNEKSSHRAAKKMSLFVIAFMIQWGPTVVYALWHIHTISIPVIVLQIVTTFPNIGGVLNGIVYHMIRRKPKTKNASKQVDTKTSQISCSSRELVENQNNVIIDNGNKRKGIRNDGDKSKSINNDENKSRDIGNDGDNSQHNDNDRNSLNMISNNGDVVNNADNACYEDDSVRENDKDVVTNANNVFYEDDTIRENNGEVMDNVDVSCYKNVTVRMYSEDVVTNANKTFYEDDTIRKNNEEVMNDAGNSC